MYATRTRAFRANPAGYPLAEPRAYQVNAVPRRLSGLGCDCQRVAPGAVRALSGPAGVRRTYRRTLGDGEGLDESSFIDSNPWSEEVNISSYGSSAYGALLPPILAPSLPGLLPPIAGVSTPAVVSGGAAASGWQSFLAPLTNVATSLIKTFTGSSAPRPAAQASGAALQSVLQTPVGTVAGPSAISPNMILYAALGVAAFALIAGRKR